MGAQAIWAQARVISQSFLSRFILLSSMHHTTSLRAVSSKGVKAGKRQIKQQKAICREKTQRDVENVEAGCKGPIAMLQEFVQCSRSFPLPPSCSALQWKFETRM